MKTKLTKKSFWLLLAALSSTLLFSCKKNNEASGINYQLKTTSPSSTVARTTGTVSWTSGYALASEIKFEAKKEGNDFEQKSKVGQKVDLFASVSNIGAVQLPAGTYKKVEFKIELLPSQTAVAFELKGTYGSKAVTLQVNEALEIKGEKEGVDISDGASYTAATSLNLSLLTLGISSSMLDNATVTNGEILISSTSNASLYAIMLANLKNLGDCDLSK
jgi:hypothetical protein